MTTRITKKRVTVYCDEEIVRLLLQLCIDHAGAGDPELFRMGLRALAAQTPPVPIQPQVAAPANIKSVLASVRGLSGVLDRAVRNGWPDHIEGESPQRHKRVEEARADFQRALIQLKPTLSALIALAAALSVLPFADATALRRGARKVDTAVVKRSDPDLEALADFLRQVGVGQSRQNSEK